MEKIEFVYADDMEELHEITEQVLGMAFRNAGKPVHVTHVYDGQQLVDYVRQNKVDGIITDVDMPNKSGLEALTELKNEGKTLKALVVTGRPTEERARQIEAVNAQAIYKPYAFTDFIQKLQGMWPEYASVPQQGTSKDTYAA